MNLFDALDWKVWKNLSLEVKNQVISQLIMSFVNPLQKVSEVKRKEFTQGGIKCETFEFLIDGEPFVFIPGSKEVILGWDSGIQGVSMLECDPLVGDFTEDLKRIMKSYELKTKEDWTVLLNESTSPLRKVSVEPMFVQKYPQPIGTTFIGKFDMITGKFSGDDKQISHVKESFFSALGRPQSFEESLSWKQPFFLSKTDCFVAMQETIGGKMTDSYLIYKHTNQSYTQLVKELDKGVYRLLTENQWEYVVGAGTRRLFRWGNEFNSNGILQKYFLEQMILEDNMFGLSVSGPMPHWELIDSPYLKLEKSRITGITLIDSLPQSSYYRSRTSVSKETTLTQTDFFYRKVILIQP